MSKKLNKYRIKERLSHAFLMASCIPAAVAVVVLIVLIAVAQIGRASCRDRVYVLV